MARIQFLLLAISAGALFEGGFGALVDPETVKCGPSEYAWCEFSNGLTRGGSSPRKCAGQCLCEGHPSFHGDNLDWKDGKCVTPKGHACGKSTDGTMEISCAPGSICIEGRCRDPNAPKLAARKRCQEDVECESGLKCRVHYVSSPPLPRPKRAIGPQYCCSAREEESPTYTMATLPCD